MPTLARLCFWVSSERMGAFEATYSRKITPILRKHRLEESSEPGRRTVDRVFSRLFEVETPAQVAITQRALDQDPAWRAMLESLGTTFGTTETDGLLRAHFRIYSTPAGSGRRVDAGHGFRQGVWQRLSVQDGLPSPMVGSILQDREGGLWFAGRDGVTRYDGETFVTFTQEDGLVGRGVRCIAEDRTGGIWFGGDGISRYAPSVRPGDRSTTFTVCTAQNGRTGSSVTAILEDHTGHLWFGGEGVVCRYSPESVDAGAPCATFTTEDGLAGSYVSSIVEDRSGCIWFGTEGGVSRYDPSADTETSLEPLRTFTTQDGLVGDQVPCMCADRGGDVWFGTFSEGVSRYDGRTFVPFTTDDGLANNQVRAIFEDREGYLWFGTMGGGVSRYDGKHVSAFTTENGLANNGVMALLEDRSGDLWFGTWGGVSRYNGNEFITFTTEDGLTNNRVWTILEDRHGSLWFGPGMHGGGVVRYVPSADPGEPGETFVKVIAEKDLGSRAVWSMLEDRRGHLWFGTRGGAVRYDPSADPGGGQPLVIFTEEDGLPGNRVSSMLEDTSGNLWFGTGRGVARHNPSAGSEGTRDTFVTLAAEGVSPPDAVMSMLEDASGNLWFGTSEGVTRYDGRTSITFTTADGLAYDQVHCIFEDTSGHLWFGTWGGGISRYDGRVFQALFTRHGLMSDTVQAILQDRNGDIWIGTEGGVTRYRSSHTPPGIRIRDVVADRRYGPVEEIHIPASQKLVAFEFRGRSLTTHWEDMAYLYRLEGWDSEWRPSYTGRVEYQDLPLGEYTFQVQAVDRDLNYSEPVSVRVHVEPDPHIEALTEALSESGPAGEFVGESRALRRIQTQLREVAPTDLTVLILGETGTGKGLAARALHELSPRANGPFIQVHCGAIPETLVESELFGHEKGAFTGAISRKLGKVELAEGGTLFLDEIGDMPLDAQVKLLRLLEEREFDRVGGTETLTADARILAATNRDLPTMVSEGTFREDLYFRLQVFMVELPPLRERREDIPLLAAYFLAQIAAHVGRPVTRLTPGALRTLTAHDWPGNVRELEHAIQRAVIGSTGDSVREEDIVLAAGAKAGDRPDALVPLEEHERRYILYVLEQTGWVIGGAHGAASVLGLAEGTLRSRMKKLGIARPT